MAQTLSFAHTSSSPEDALHLLKHDLPHPGSGKVLVKMLAAPINPLDLLVIQGKYPVKPLSYEGGEMIPGYDGVGAIVECGEGVEELKAGDFVIIKCHGLGTWRTHAVHDVHDLLQVPKEMDPKAAAILRMGILAGHLLLEQNVQGLRPGDWIVLNAATGVIPHFLVQFARRKGLHVISVIRERDNVVEVKRRLQRHGADIVLEEKEVAETQLLRGKNVILGFDAVFGASGQDLIGMLSTGATYVSYGFLGGIGGPEAAITITQELIFIKNITFKAFRLSAVLASLTDQDQSALCIWLSDLLDQRQINMPLLDLVDWNSPVAKEETLKEAVGRSSQAHVGQHKAIFVFR